MAPCVTYATNLLLTAACWHQVSGESVFLSRRSSNTTPSGTSAALSEEGYQQVASLKSDEQMNEFILRILHEDGLEGNTSYLQGLVPWYSGKRAVQSLARLREELTKQPWVKRVSQASFVSKKATLGPIAFGDASANVSEKGPCKPTCYGTLRAMLSWKDHKCFWKFCVGCPECGGELHHEKNTPLAARDAQRHAVQRANASRQQEHNQQHHHGRPERDALLSGKETNPSKIRQAQRHAGDRSNRPWKKPYTNPDENLHHRQRSRKTAGVAKNQQISYEFAVDKAASNAASSMSNAELEHVDPLPEEQVEDEKLIETANPAKTDNSSNDRIHTVSEGTPRGGDTPEKALERNQTTVFVANPVSSHAVTTAKTAEAMEPKPSFEADLIVVPKAEKTTNGSTQAPPLSKKSEQVNASEAQLSFHAKVAAAVAANIEADGTKQDADQLSDSRVLPAVPSLLDKSKHVLEALNEHVNTLKNQLAEAESESQKTVSSKRNEYEHALEQQIENSTSMAKANEQLGREIQKLREQNTELRNLAMLLKAKGAQLHKHMLELKANITLAEEYLEGVLESRSNDSSAFSVLRELDEQDAALAKSRAHASALRQVTAVLLQTSRTESADVREVVRNLKERFDDLDREKAASIAALKQQFDEEFSKELRHQDVLKEHGRQLTTDRDRELALREKLQAAVNHLEHAVSSLEKQIQGLHAYAERVSSTP